MIDVRIRDTSDPVDHDDRRFSPRVVDAALIAGALALGFGAAALLARDTEPPSLSVTTSAPSPTQTSATGE